MLIALICTLIIAILILTWHISSLTDEIRRDFLGLGPNEIYSSNEWLKEFKKNSADSNKKKGKK